MTADKKSRSPRKKPSPAADPNASTKSRAPRSEQPDKNSQPQKTAPPRIAARTKSPSRSQPSSIDRVPLQAVEPRPASDERLSIVLVSPEAHPFAKTGGLAEVASALSDALVRLGHAVTIVLPRYRGIDTKGIPSYPFTVRLGSRAETITVYEREVPSGVRVAFVDAPALFDRDGLYGDANGDYADNAWRFAIFSRSALEYVRARGRRPSVIHTHDWQTGLVPVYQKMHLSTDSIVGGVPVVQTIHNLAFQGLYPASTLDLIGLGWEVFTMQAMEFWGQISYLKGGINFSEKITTVSPTYAREVLRPELGFGFDGVLARRANDLVGILNGIDTTRWDPSTDPFIAAPFAADDLSNKRLAKKALLQRAGLPADDRAIARPVVGLVSRLTDQKGFDLIAAAVENLMTLETAWVMLGSGERRYEDLWRDLAARHADRVSTTIGFDEPLAHQIEAGADMFLMPSRFEPCGLNQMYSLRYGTVPIVRATGGLDDTVKDFDPVTGRGTGFKFTDYSPAALVQAIARAIEVYRNSSVWKDIQRAGMREDHSWDAAAREYVKVYRAMQRADRPVREVNLASARG